MLPAISASSGGRGGEGYGDEFTAFLLDRFNDRKMFLLFHYD